MFSFMPKKSKKEKSKLSRSKVVKKLDAVFSRFIRFRDCDKHGIVTCPLCGVKMPRKKAQNMHFISRKNMKYRFDEDNCHAWCQRCNVTLNGNYIEYTLYMVNRYWVEKTEAMKHDKQAYKIETWELEEMIEYYKLKNAEYERVKNLKN